MSTIQHQDEEEVDPYNELERYLGDGLVSKTQCPEPIPWWGGEYFIVQVRRLAKAYDDN